MRGERLAGPARIVSGDEFRLGSVPFNFSVAQTSAATETGDS